MASHLLHWGAARLSSLMRKLEWVGYLSTVGVYGDMDGAWVDEENRMPACVAALRGADTERKAGGRPCAASGLPVACSGSVYLWAGAQAFVNLKEGTAKRIVKAHQVYNRIRVEDIGAATLGFGPSVNLAAYNVTDDTNRPRRRMSGHSPHS